VCGIGGPSELWKGPDPCASPLIGGSTDLGAHVDAQREWWHAHTTPPPAPLYRLSVSVVRSCAARVGASSVILFVHNCDNNVLKVVACSLRER